MQQLQLLLGVLVIAYENDDSNARNVLSSGNPLHSFGPVNHHLPVAHASLLSYPPQPPAVKGVPP